MPYAAKAHCSVPLCDGYAEFDGRCLKHRRGNSAERGYSGPRWRAAHRATIRRDPVCVLCRQRPSVVADHYPYSRKQLIEMGIKDPDDPKYLRGLCRSCNSRQTALRQPGGWNKR